MKKALHVFTAVFIFTLTGSLFAGPKMTFTELITAAEKDANLVSSAHHLASQKNLPVTILTADKVMIDAKGIENGNVVYSVITNPADIYDNSFTVFFEEAEKRFDFSASLIIYPNGNITDNTNGLYRYELEQSTRGIEKFLLITDWTFDRVWAFNPENGDIIDTAFISHSNPQLLSPKHALQTHDNFILVSDQIADLVQKFDTSGFYISHFAPSGGVNVTIVDNMRGIAFRPNRNLLATVGSGVNQNTIQEFDMSGNHIGSFIPAGTLNSPFDIHYRSNDILVTNSSGPNDVTSYDLNGTFISNFIVSTNLTFPQQILRMPNGNISVCGFSSPSGLIQFDSSGNYIRSMSAVTGLRGAYLLGNGNYLVTNATGVNEMDSASGNLIRVVASGSNFQYISEYIPGGLVGLSNISNAVPEKFSLSQNYPNPFNPNTNINYQISVSGNVNLSVYDVLGNEVMTLVNEKQNPGTYSVNFDGSNFSSGVYFYKLITGDFSETKQMILLK
ncbi:MAG: T9SS type A sorting domain-containing protein [Ignavibacteria bacterium]|nr:T9SS type A sorting domain-containing protein [Ignavibacteria bacterium]